MMALLFAAAALAAAPVALDPAPPDTLAPVLWAGLSPGRYRVGYRRLETAGGVVHTWYPTAATGTPLRFQDYLGAAAPRLASFLAQAGMHPASVDTLFASPLYAVPSVHPLTGLFPLVLIGQGNGQDVADQVVLCEYLASQGFVVAATPSPMLRTPLEREDQVGPLAELQAGELAAAIGVVAAELPVDRERLAVVGHSFGARAALLLGMRDRRIRAIVSLDGGIGTATAADEFRRAPSFREDAELPPLLHFYEELDAFMAPDFRMLRALHTAELVLTATAAMHHAHFTTYGFAAARFPDLARATQATPATAGAVVGVAERTTTFLRRWVR